MDKNQYLLLLSADVAAKMSPDVEFQFDPATLLLIGQIILEVIECVNEDQIKDPSLLNSIKLGILVRKRAPRKMRREIKDALLKWGEETDKMTLRRMIARLKQSD